MLAAGSFSTISILSDAYQSRFALTFSDLNVISAVANVSLYLGYLAVGPLYDLYGVRITMLFSTITYTFGYVMILLSYIGTIPTNSAAIAIYYFISGTGACGGYMVVCGANSSNFDESKVGLVLGSLLIFYGLSGVIFSQIFAALFVGKIEAFLLFLIIVVFVVNFLATLIMYQENSRFKELPKELVQVNESRPLLDESPVGISPIIQSEVVLSQDIQTAVCLNTVAIPIEFPSKTPIRPDTSMTPRQIIFSTIFWTYALSTICQQGLSYMANINNIIRSAEGPDSTSIIALTTLHVTYYSSAQSVARFLFAFGSDYITKYKMNRAALLVVAEVLLLIPPLILSFFDYSNLTKGPTLTICSILVGAGWGAGGGLYPTMTRSLFGTKYYGTASSFVLLGVPIGIFVSNTIFGRLYDMQLAIQSSNGGPTDFCYGTNCFRVAFISTSAIQSLSLLTAMILYYIVQPKRVR